MFKAHEILDYFKDTIGMQKTRRRVYVDKRNYVIAVLYYKFKYTEEELSEIFGTNRTTINHGKKQPNYLFTDALFTDHTKELRELFPYVFPDPVENMKKPRSHHKMILNLEPDLYDKLKFKAELEGVYVKTVAINLLRKVVKIWEE